MAQTAENVFRDFTTDGVPSSGAHKPKKAEVRDWGAVLESGLNALASNGGLIYQGLTALNGNLNYPSLTMVWVVNDTTPANNGIYQKQGASGAGSWLRLLDLPYSFIKASNVGAGTANAIVATLSIPVPSADGSALITVNVTAVNTGPATISFSGGPALPIKSNSGNDIVAGGLKVGMILAGYISGGTFRLLSDQASAAILTAAEAAASYAKEWANNPVDDPVSVPAGGDDASTFSARHWAQKALDAAGSAGSGNYSSRTILKTVEPTAPGQVAYLSEEGREGKFRWRAGNYTAQVAGDPLEGLYVESSVPGFGRTVGVWERVVANRTVTPEFWGGVDIGDGATDATTAWQAALASGYHVNGTPEANYYTTAALGAPASGAIIDLCGSKITADWEQSTGEYEAVFFLDGAHKATFKGGVIEYIGTFDNGSSYTGLVSGIQANNSNKLLVENMEIFGFSRCGVLVGAIVAGAGTGYCQQPRIVSCHLHHNRVAGASYGNTDDGFLIDTILSFNGAVGDVGTGYGFTGSSAQLPRNTTVRGCHATDNYRKGIDFHNGQHGIIDGNTCLRNRIMAIYCEGVKGEWIISNNSISDMTWADLFPGHVMYGIMVGSQSGQGVSEIPTSFLIHGNTISNFTKTAGQAFPIFWYGSGLSYGNIKISDNIIRADTVTQIISSAADGSASLGNWNDIEISNNMLEAVTCDVANFPIYIRGTKNRRKAIIGNTITVTNITATGGVVSYDNTSITNHCLIFVGNSIVAPASGWSTAAGDPVGLKRGVFEQFRDNIVNGIAWRDYDGRRFIASGPGANPPSDGKHWTVGSIWWRSDAAAAGSMGSVCTTAGTIGTWKAMANLAA